MLLMLLLLHYLHIFTDFLLILYDTADGRTASTFFTDFLLIVVDGTAADGAASASKLSQQFTDFLLIIVDTTTTAADGVGATISPHFH